MSNEEKEYQLQLNSDYYVVTANDLIRGKQKMSLREAQLLYIAMAQVVKEDKDFKTFTTTVPDLAAFMGIAPSNLYRDIEDICTSLLKRVVKIQIGGKNAKEKWKAFQWISSASYDNGKLTIRLHDEIKPFLLELTSYYSQMLLGTLCTFRSYYTTRLYQLIVCDAGQRGQDEWNFTCDELREFFQIGLKQYKLTRDLLNYTLKPAIAELNEQDTVYVWNYEELRSSARGKPITGVRFNAIVFRDKAEKDHFINVVLPYSEERERERQEQEKRFAEEREQYKQEFLDLGE